MTRHPAPGADAQLASPVTNHGSLDQGFVAGAPTNSLSAGAGEGVLTKISGTPLAGCNGKPRPAADATYVAQAGWSHFVEHGALARKPVLIGIKASFGTTSCQNDRSATEACCDGCQHRRAAGAPP